MANCFQETRQQARESFTALKSLVKNSWQELYGELAVREVKYVHESQWYMEELEIIATVPFSIAVP